MSATKDNPRDIARRNGLGEHHCARPSAALLLAGLLLAGCGERDVPPAIPGPPAVTPLPITMGVYYPPEFRRARCEVTNMTGFLGSSLARTSVVGPAQVAAFDLVWPAMFEGVVPLETPTPAAAPGELAGVITTALDQCSLVVNGSGKIDSVSIIYHFTLTTAAGEMIATWSVLGVPSNNPHLTSGPYLQEAMRDAVAKFVAGFDTEPTLEAWRAQLPAQGKVP